MAANAPGIPILFNERRGAIERIATLSAEEVANMPLRATRHHDLAFDGRLAALAAGREELVKVEMAVEPQTRFAVYGFQA